MWLSAAHAAAPHRSKPGEERHHLPIRQEAFSRRQDLSSMASWATGSHQDHCAPHRLRAVRCGLLGIRAGHCRLCAIQAGHRARRGTRAGHCHPLEAIHRVAHNQATWASGPTIPMQPRPAGTTRRCRQARAGPACPCLRAAAHWRHSQPTMSACPQSISAARRRSALEANRFHRLRRPEDGMMMCHPNHPTDHRRGASAPG